MNTHQRPPVPPASAQVRLSAPQRAALQLMLSESRGTAAHTRDGFVSAIVAKALVERGLAERTEGHLVRITEAGRQALEGRQP